MNIYKQILKKNITKILSLYNLDRLSPTFGYGDRLFWGWKVSDFANATLQGNIGEKVCKNIEKKTNDIIKRSVDL